MGDLIHFYHIYDTPWSPRIIREHFEALISSGLLYHLETMYVGIVSTRGYVVPHAEILEISPSGWEQVTMQHIKEKIKSGDKVLYAHTKGATADYNTSYRSFIDAWRRSMTYHTVLDWKTCVADLDEVDAVGSHWLTPEQNYGHVTIDTKFFAGTFWWANADYLFTLPDFTYINRFEAESWIGYGNPTIRDKKPGYPSFDTFTKVDI